MVSIAVANATFWAEKHHLVNMLRSLVAMQPDEVNIADTSRTDAATIKEFHAWLYARAEEYGLPIKVTHEPFDGKYSKAHNRALGMCSSDWTLLIGSDEMLSLQFAHDVREYLAELPDHILAVRARMLNLIDDKTCITRDLWPPGKRRSLGVHARIYRANAGQLTGRIHEIFRYPGRTTIPLDSPKHPKADWNGGYEHCMLHLWMYGDNLVRRKMFRHVPQMPLDASPKEAYTTMRRLWLEHRSFEPAPVPDGVTWVPIIWEIEPDKWSYVQEGGKWCYKNYYGQGGR